MRIDKFLWSIRFYKTRTVATEEIKKNRVSIGDSVVKASKEVKEGDIIKIRKNQVDYKIKVIQIPKSRMAAKLVPLHIKDVTDKEQYELLRLRKISQDYYRNRGEGRPTKKDRREIDGYVGNDIDSDFTDWDDFFGENDNDDIENEIEEKS
ncbi:RNA-binding S4 domain-containing protein [Chryseobacterium paridis]|uniref:RNA-binding S4 domain-containing protein n=1 Tax=Chryseobacterium paridis TaxID=2800328 RepID=A0ABS1FS93_9FLAO|nr:RNA-binding S4 domain-containing protein [Chryseobacterium paridis]MBK1895297.1 RNA-binding S4 domain-containing protein [Chryseobacterium paridis]